MYSCRRFKSDGGFMGNTHALSVVAVVLSFAAFLPAIFFKNVLPAQNIILLIVAVIVAVGAGLLPDLDNTQSSAISTLGIVGTILSMFMRSTSELIYSFSHTKKEPAESDPHRGFWHTLVAGILVAFLLMLLMKLNAPFMKLGNVSVSIATITLFLLLLISTELLMTALLHKFTKRTKGGSFGALPLWVIGIVVSSVLVGMLPATKDYTWVAIMFVIGYSIHILGDTITTSGTPILFPLSHNGKRWWSYRLPPHIHANGDVEKHIFFPIFLIIAIIAVIKLFMGGIL